MNRFTTDYGLKHRDEIKAKYGDFEQFNKNFVVRQDLIQGLQKAAEEAKVEWNEEQFQHSEKFILLQVKALIARNVWETQEYYRVMSSTDPGVQKALEILNDKKAFSKILSNK